MRDPHIHIERSPFMAFGHAEMREMILAATGLACDMPKTVGTGCGKRRPLAMTSKIPEHVTCIGCREYARKEYLSQAESGEALLTIPADDPIWDNVKISRETVAAEARKDRALAARYS